MSRPFPPDMFQREQSTPKITQQLERRFTNGLLSVKDQEKSFCTHKSACEFSLWSLSYR